MEIKENNIIYNEKAFIIGVLKGSMPKETIDEELDELQLFQGHRLEVKSP